VSPARPWILGAWLNIATFACASSPELTVAAAPDVAIAAGAEDRPPPDLYVGCADRSNCPNAIAMLVVDDDSSAEPERCTATLIASDRMLTASHCLASADRHRGAACARTWVSFPQTVDAPAEWVACKRVLNASEVMSEDGLHQEHAVLQLIRAVRRKPLAVDPRPPEPNSIVQVVSITPHPIYGSTHELASRLCRAIPPDGAVRELGAHAAQVGWLGNCPIARGNSGSPVIDWRGRIRAIVHGGTATAYEFGVTSGL
jgi:hypothetical protein